MKKFYKKKSVYFIFSIFIMVQTSMAKDLDEVSDSANKKLVVSSLNIELSKICDKIIVEALKTINIDVEPFVLPSKRAALMSNSGETDGEICRIEGFNKTYSNLIRIDPAIIPLVSNVFTKDKEVKIVQDGWDVLRPYTIGIHAGHYYSINGTKGFPDVMSLTTDRQLIGMLNLGRLDFAVMLTHDALHAITKANLVGKIRLLQPPISKNWMHFYVHKKNKHLVPYITKAINAFVISGQAMAIYNEFAE